MLSMLLAVSAFFIFAACFAQARIDSGLTSDWLDLLSFNAAKYVPVESFLSTVKPLLGTAGEMLCELLSTELRINVGILALISAPLVYFGLGGKRPVPEEQAKAKAKEKARLEQRRRQRLTKMRAGSKLFPPPYPNGWYPICREEEVPKGEAIPASSCGQEFAVFRNEKGKIAVLHAFCPHLGTHLGHGGKVVKDAVVCPYHSWSFDAQGKCVDIPYCPKAPTERTNTKSYDVRVKAGMVFVWLHADGEPPFYELTVLDELEEKGMTFVNEVPVDDWHMHIMEPAQNAADPYHFNTTHQWLGANPGDKASLWLKHKCKSYMGTLGDDWPLEGGKVPASVVGINEAVSEAWLFGIIPLPSMFNSHYRAGALFQGVSVSILHIDTPMVGSVRVIFFISPESPFVQKMTVRVYATRWFPRWFARWFGRMGVMTANQDRPVWENKLAVAPRNVVAGDGPFAAYGQWLKQFYSPSSKAFGELSLEW
eukprot:CAMPEP_0197632596 /NCGR_PEP_ID=MMETSP1338-20131121/9266_1 /TAXON_ID=43686 ORGANISM="Pelagodinium beii, Strain RCC1491" /NCGR_SAMPLE_ID=MMETSP1338 /ASSEMBLY_ACC=CAM_ASM_000754 /LENGTH=480 /DNA_ID=CAMNT_0043204159 /DNA_START=21 /DNA_END=1463 /DNA_ORIENTATION=+